MDEGGVGRGDLRGVLRDSLESAHKAGHTVPRTGSGIDSIKKYLSIFLVKSKFALKFPWALSWLLILI